jgi:hypothetical protein
MRRAPSFSVQASHGVADTPRFMGCGSASFRRHLGPARSARYQDAVPRVDRIPLAEFVEVHKGPLIRAMLPGDLV